jgi:hypothetical protein
MPRTVPVLISGCRGTELCFPVRGVVNDGVVTAFPQDLAFMRVQVLEQLSSFHWTTLPWFGDRAGSAL